MSVRIKDMNMPKVCAGCRFFSPEDKVFYAERNAVYCIGVYCHAAENWIGEDITDGDEDVGCEWKHAVKNGERWKDCPLEDEDERMEDDGK